MIGGTNAASGIDERRAATCIDAARGAVAKRKEDLAFAVLEPLLEPGCAVRRADVAAVLRDMADWSPRARSYLGAMTLTGEGVARDAAEAGRLLSSAAAEGEEDVRGHALTWLGHLRSGVYGGPADPAGALRHYERAAALGEDEAAYRAGLLRERGPDEVRDAAAAARMYRAAADRGHVAAMTGLARTLLARVRPGGDNAPLVDEAAALLEDAAAGGDAEAAEALERLDAGLGIGRAPRRPH